MYKSNNIIKDRDRILVRCKGCGTIKEVNARSFIRLVAKTDKFPGKLECKICRQKRKDAEKAFDIIQHPFIIKKLSRK